MSLPHPVKAGRNCSQSKATAEETSAHLPYNEGQEAGHPLMQCRYCLRHELGYCVRRGGQRPTWREPLYLRLGDGRRFRLEFECTKCQMNVLADEK